MKRQYSDFESGIVLFIEATRCREVYRQRIYPKISCCIKITFCIFANPIRDVAQSGSVYGWGPCGRRFKSCHPDRVEGGRVVVRTDHPDTATTQLPKIQVVAFFGFGAGVRVVVPTDHPDRAE